MVALGETRLPARPKLGLLYFYVCICIHSAHIIERRIMSQGCPLTSIHGYTHTHSCTHVCVDAHTIQNKLKIYF